MSQKRRRRADEPFLLVRSLAHNHEAGETIDRHSHDWHQLIHAAAGVLTVWTERGSWIAPPSWAVWVPARIAHAIRFSTTSELRTLYVRPGWAEALPDQCSAVSISPLLRELILRAVRIGMLDSRDPLEAALATLLAEEFRQSHAPPFELPQPHSPALRRAATADATSTAGLASGIGMGKRTLERHFRAETGMSPARWRRHKALLGAVEQLAAGAPVKAVAASAGYRGPSAFVAAFRRQFGVTPSRYFERH
jgi:AraC-like DNA-binding protein